MDKHKNKKKLIITILLENLIVSENLAYEFKKIIYGKIIKQLEDM